MVTATLQALESTINPNTNEVTFQITLSSPVNNITSGFVMVNSGTNNTMIKYMLTRTALNDLNDGSLTALLVVIDSQFVQNDQYVAYAKLYTPTGALTTTPLTFTYQNNIPVSSVPVLLSSVSNGSTGFIVNVKATDASNVAIVADQINFTLTSQYQNSSMQLVDMSWNPTASDMSNNFVPFTFTNSQTLQIVDDNVYYVEAEFYKRNYAASPNMSNIIAAYPTDQPGAPTSVSVSYDADKNPVVSFTSSADAYVLPMKGVIFSDPSGVSPTLYYLFNSDGTFSLTTQAVFNASAGNSMPASQRYSITISDLLVNVPYNYTLSEINIGPTPGVKSSLFTIFIQQNPTAVTNLQYEAITTGYTTQYNSQLSTLDGSSNYLSYDTPEAFNVTFDKPTTNWPTTVNGQQVKYVISVTSYNATVAAEEIALHALSVLNAWTSTSLTTIKTIAADPSNSLIAWNGVTSWLGNTPSYGTPSISGSQKLTKCGGSSNLLNAMNAYYSTLQLAYNTNYLMNLNGGIIVMDTGASSYSMIADGLFGASSSNYPCYFIWPSGTSVNISVTSKIVYSNLSINLSGPSVSKTINTCIQTAPSVNISAQATPDDISVTLDLINKMNGLLFTSYDLTINDMTDSSLSRSLSVTANLDSNNYPSLTTLNLAATGDVVGGHTYNITAAVHGAVNNTLYSQGTHTLLYGSSTVSGIAAYSQVNTPSAPVLTQSGSSLVVSFDSVSDANLNGCSFGSYQVTLVDESNSSSSVTMPITTRSTTSYTFTGLTNSHFYHAYYKIVTGTGAVVDSLVSPNSVTLQYVVYTKVNTPAAPTLSLNTDTGAMTVTFTGVTNANLNGSVFNNYLITLVDSVTETSVAVESIVTQQANQSVTKTFSGLTLGNSYKAYYQIVATANLGISSSNSAYSNTLLDYIKPTAPGTSHKLTLSDSNTSSLVVTITNPSNDGLNGSTGADIQSYTTTLYNTLNSNTVLATVTGSTTTFSIGSSLVVGNSYFVKTFATSKKGLDSPVATSNTVIYAVALDITSVGIGSIVQTTPQTVNVTVNFISNGAELNKVFVALATDKGDILQIFTPPANQTSPYTASITLNSGTTSVSGGLCVVGDSVGYLAYTTVGNTSHIVSQ